MSEVLLSITRRGRSKTGQKQDRSTLLAIRIVIISSIGAGVFVAGNFRAGMLPYADLFVAAGVVLFALGLLLRWWAIITLGRFFTVDVVVEKDHEVVERGPFRLVRHPSYAGVLLAFVGFALTLRNWAAMLVVLVPIFAAFIHRMNVEEEALCGALGERYADYMTHAQTDSIRLLRSDPPSSAGAGLRRDRGETRREWRIAGGSAFARGYGVT